MYLLGYIPAHNRIYLADKDIKVYGYSLSLNLIEYQSAILRGDMEAAEEILPTVPKDQRSRVAHFLEARGMFKRDHIMTNLLNRSTSSFRRPQGARVTGYNRPRP